MRDDFAENDSFLRYAARYWTEHLALCRTSASQEMKRAVKHLLDAHDGKCKRWVQVFSAETSSEIYHQLPEFAPTALAAYFNLGGILDDLVPGEA